jgi:hypothetical protein
MTDAVEVDVQRIGTLTLFRTAGNQLTYQFRWELRGVDEANAVAAALIEAAERLRNADDPAPRQWGDPYSPSITVER